MIAHEDAIFVTFDPFYFLLYIQGVGVQQGTQIVSVEKVPFHPFTYEKEGVKLALEYPIERDWDAPVVPLKFAC
jgi:hypothetical protein